MALPDYSGLVEGTSVTWSTSGTYALTLTSLADAAARQGVKGDLNDAAFGPIPEVLVVTLETKMAVAAANGTVIEVYAGQSNNAVAATANPSKLTGADAAFTTPAEYKKQLDPVGAMNLSNNAGTGTQRQQWRFYPTQRYWMPVVLNRGGQALSATPGDHTLTVTPYFRKIQD